MASAVAGWSPVIITTRMPAARHCAMASGTSARSGSARPTRPRKPKPKSAGRPAARRGRQLGRGHAEHPQAVAGQRRAPASAMRRGCAAPGGTGRRSPRARPWRRPRARRSRDCHTWAIASSSGRQRVASTSASRACSAGVRQRRPRRLADAPSPSGRRRAVAGQRGDSSAGCRHAAALRRRGAVARAGAPQRRTAMRLRVSVPVLSAHSTVVAPSVSIAGGVARQHLVARQPPGAQHQEHGQHQREFLGQDRHRQCDAGEQAVQPVAARSAHAAAPAPRPGPGHTATTR